MTEKKLTYAEALDTAIKVMPDGEVKEKLLALKASITKKNTERKPEFDIVENADNPENPNFESKDKDKMTVMITSTYSADSKVNFVKLSKSNINFLEWLYNNGYLDPEIKYSLVKNEIDF